MGKFGRLFLNLLILAVMLPMLYYFTEYFTAPVGHTSTSGTVYAAGGILTKQIGVGTAGLALDANTVALVAAIPWLLPLFVLIYTIVDFVKPEKPEGM